MSQIVKFSDSAAADDDYNDRPKVLVAELTSVIMPENTVVSIYRASQAFSTLKSIHVAYLLLSQTVTEL